jgi:hypothetical protein
VSPFAPVLRNLAAPTSETQKNPKNSKMAILTLQQKKDKENDLISKLFPVFFELVAKLFRYKNHEDILAL